MSTPHIAARPGEIAPWVLMPGDPARGRFIADAFLDDVLRVSDVRNMETYTGEWQGRPISVVPSGMGVPSMAIYATELFLVYGVQAVVRVGTCGSPQEEAELGDVLLAEHVLTDSCLVSE